jgi:hypothetical protein
MAKFLKRPFDRDELLHSASIDSYSPNVSEITLGAGVDGWVTWSTLGSKSKIQGAVASDCWSPLVNHSLVAN